MRNQKQALRFTPRGKWRVTVSALRRQLADGSLTERDRQFIEHVLPGFCDFAAGKVKSWSSRAKAATS